MLIGFILIGLLAALAMPDFGDDSAARDAGDGLDPVDDPAPELSEPGSDILADSGEQTYIAGGAPGLTVIAGFEAGSDHLQLRLPGNASEITLTDGTDTDPASLSYRAGDDVTEVRFEGLAEVPIDDISVLIDGEGAEIALGSFLSDAIGGDDTALQPLPGDTPSEPGDGTDDDAIAPVPGDTPAAPGGGGDGDALDPVNPDIPAVPAGQPVASVAVSGPDAGAALEPTPGDTPAQPGAAIDDLALPPVPGDTPAAPGGGGDGDALDPVDPDIPAVPAGQPVASVAVSGPDAGAALEPTPGDSPAQPGAAIDDPALAPVPGDTPAEPGGGGDGDALDPVNPDIPAVPAGTAGAQLVENFIPGEEMLRVSLAPDIAGNAVSVAPSADGADALVTINGVTVAVLQGAPAASIADLLVEALPAAG